MRALLGLCAVSICACNAASAPAPDELAKTTGSESPADARPRASDRAERFAKFRQRDGGGTACPTFAAGVDVVLGDFSYRFERPLLSDPETRLPWIANVDERRALSREHVKLLVVPFAVRNDAPAAGAIPHGIVLVTRDGETHGNWPYNERLWNTTHGRRALWNDRLGPDTWVETAYVFDVNPAELEGAVLSIARVTYERDRNGRSRRIVREQAVVDLAPAIPSDPIRGG